MIWILIFCFASGLLTDGAVTTCSHNDHKYQLGDSWVADDDCNGCDCTQFGAECATWRNCDNSNSLGRPGEVLCKYGHTYHKVGQRWTAEDKCNKCNCTTRGMVCTFKSCTNTGFAKPKPNGGQFMDCPYKGHYYRYKDQFLTEDGCNTCICVMPGNFATFPICTTTKCNMLPQHD